MAQIIFDFLNDVFFKDWAFAGKNDLINLIVIVSMILLLYWIYRFFIYLFKAASGKFYD